MNIFTLSVSYIRHKLLATLLHIMTFSCGIAMIVILFLGHTQIEHHTTRNLQGIDLVVSGKGSPLQIILSSIFHIDIPTGNISVSDADIITQNPMVKSTIPVALGDNYNGFRIVGTTADYIYHYGGTISQGKVFEHEMQSVVGYNIAQKYNLKIGDKLLGSHGLTGGGDVHKDMPYHIVGILEKNNSVLDSLILTPVSSVWHIHEHHHHSDHKEHGENKEHDKHKETKQITALLVTYKTPMAAVILPRMINSDTKMQAASPAFEMARLNKFIGIGSVVFENIAYFLIALSSIHIIISMIQMTNERCYDMALMRSMGALPQKIMLMLLTQTMFMSFISVIFGLILGHGFIHFIGYLTQNMQSFSFTGTAFYAQELWVFILAVSVGIISAVIPIIKLYRLNIFQIITTGR